MPVKVILLFVNVLVNPPSHIKIKLWTLGFLIASNASDARRYCTTLILVHKLEP